MALYFIIPINILLAIMMAFLIVLFFREKGDENKIREQLDTIKKTYDEKTKEYETAAAESSQKMNDALEKANAAEAESQKVNQECEIKIATMTQSVDQKMLEVKNLEDTIRQEAEERIKEFEQEQKEEVEKNMVSLVMNVTQEVFKKTLSYEDHKNLIKKSIEEMKFEE